MNEKPNALLARARRLHQSGGLDEAQQAYEEILSCDSENPDALHFLGLLHYQRGDEYKGVELISQAITHHPEYVDAYLNLGNILLKLREINETYACYAKAYELAPQRYECLTNFGILLRHMRHLDQSETLLQEAVNLQPDIGVGYFNLANTQVLNQKLDQAVDNLSECMRLSPDVSPAYTAFANFCYRAGRASEAASVYRKRLQEQPDNPNLIHMLAAVSGENVPSHASADYVRATFNQYADSFDQSLNSLDYNGPEQMGEALGRLMDANADLTILDACCGTGLCAQFLKPYAANLIGVDLAQGMLDRAKERGAYDELFCEDLAIFLKDKENEYDVLVSIDSLIYFGDLAEVVRLCTQALKSGGHIIFTLEQPTPNVKMANGFGLASHGRYVHERDYVNALLNSNALSTIQLDACVTRKELGEDVNGWLVVAQNRGVKS